MHGQQNVKKIRFVGSPARIFVVATPTDFHLRKDIVQVQRLRNRTGKIIHLKVYIIWHETGGLQIRNWMARKVNQPAHYYKS